MVPSVGTAGSAVVDWEDFMPFSFLLDDANQRFCYF
jgi:hypothetical protein